MTETARANATGVAICDDVSAAVARGIARWLCLAATPAFAIMALMTGVLGGSPMDMIRPPGHGPPLVGMASMYMLMSAFHSAPWLKLISSRRSGARRNPAAPVVPTVRCPARSHLSVVYSNFGYQSAPRSLLFYVCLPSSSASARRFATVASGARILAGAGAGFGQLSPVSTDVFGGMLLDRARRYGFGSAARPPGSGISLESWRRTGGRTVRLLRALRHGTLP